MNIAISPLPSSMDTCAIKKGQGPPRRLAVLAGDYTQSVCPLLIHLLPVSYFSSPWDRVSCSRLTLTWLCSQGMILCHSEWSELSGLLKSLALSLPQCLCELLHHFPAPDVTQADEHWLLFSQHLCMTYSHQHMLTWHPPLSSGSGLRGHSGQLGR